jgi:hypothetical protein
VSDGAILLSMTDLQDNPCFGFRVLGLTVTAYTGIPCLLFGLFHFCMPCPLATAGFRVLG